MKRQSLFVAARSKPKTRSRRTVNEALHDALSLLGSSGRAGVEQGTISQRSGARLESSDLSTRRAEMRRVLRDAMRQRAGAIDDGDHLIVKLAGADIVLVPDAIPAAITVGAAREMVGQPFLHDYELF